jgi:hypothetical protein
MIYLQYTKTYTKHSHLAHKGQKVKATQKFISSAQWLTWSSNINSNEHIDYTVSDFITLNRNGEPL